MKVLLVNGSPHKKGCTWTASNGSSKNPEQRRYRHRNFLDWHKTACRLYCVQDMCQNRALHV